MKVLITGGAGFVGSHLAEAFLDRGDEVTVLDLASDLKVRHLRERSGFRMIRESVFKTDILEGVVAWADLVYHLAAVVGVPHPHSGEAVTAYVVPATGANGGAAAEVDEEELVAWCADHLARYKCPVKISFVDELPHSLTGKIVRRSLR